VQKIVPHLWFDKEALDAARLYTSTIPGSSMGGLSGMEGTPSGDVTMLGIKLAGLDVNLLNAGPMFTFNPSVSFLLSCESDEEVDRIVGRLGDGGGVLMPLGAYPFAARYAWISDRYGLSWQVIHREGPLPARRLTPTQMFVGPQCGRAAEALRLYTRVFGNSRIEELLRYGAAAEPERPDLVQRAAFSLEGTGFALMDSSQPHAFAFNEAVSYQVFCESQEEIDRYWQALSADPAAEQCGWIKDSFGFSWQILPRELGTLMEGAEGEKKASLIKAMLGMKKLSIAGLREAAR